MRLKGTQRPGYHAPLILDYLARLREEQELVDGSSTDAGWPKKDRGWKGIGEFINIILGVHVSRTLRRTDAGVSWALARVQETLSRRACGNRVLVYS